MTSYSDEEVKEVIKGLGEFLDWAKTQHLVSENSAWKEGTKLIWAASQYLKAKPVIEWYGDKENYKRTWDENNDPQWINVIDDYGQRARKFLEGKE